MLVWGLHIAQLQLRQFLMERLCYHVKVDVPPTAKISNLLQGWMLKVMSISLELIYANQKWLEEGLPILQPLTCELEDYYVGSFHSLETCVQYLHQSQQAHVRSQMWKNLEHYKHCPPFCHYFEKLRKSRKMCIRIELFHFKKHIVTQVCKLTLQVKMNFIVTLASRSVIEKFTPNLNKDD